MRHSISVALVATSCLFATTAAAGETCPGDAIDLSGHTSCSSAVSVTSDDTSAAADDIDEETEVGCWASTGGDAAEQVWEFTLGADTYLQIDLAGSAYDTRMAIVQGCPDGGTSCLYDDDGGPGLTSGFACQLYPAGTYSVIVSGYNGATGAYDLNITECECLGVEDCPGNANPNLDLGSVMDCSAAALSVNGTTTGASDDIDESVALATCWGSTDAAEHVYEIDLPGDRALAINLFGSSYDTQLGITSPCSSGAGFCQYNDDYDFNTLQSGFDCQVYPAGTYSLIVSGWSGSTGDYVLNIDECAVCNDAFETCSGETVDISALTANSAASTNVAGTTVGAFDTIDESVEVACWANTGGDAPEHVYEFATSYDAYLQIDLSGSPTSFDSRLAVVDGCPDGNNFCVFDDDAGPSFTSSLDCQLYPTGSYSAIVSGFNGDTDDYILDIQECAGVCGDGLVNAVAETCDGDGAGTGGETATCDDDCTDVSCGDSNTNTTAGEACDDGGESQTCNIDCTVASCGDSVVNASAGEDCDDGAETATCNVDCTTAACGDSYVNTLAGEDCDDGAESATCNVDCTTASCGDSVVNGTAGEDCDDGAETATCNVDCTTAACGDSYVNTLAGEDCDDGAESATCNDDCTTSTCGDGTLNTTAGEECDDSNTDDGDGCDSGCLIEGGTGGGGTGGSTSSGTGGSTSSGTGGSTTSSGTGGSTTSSGTGGSTSSSGSSADPEEDSGCGCTVPGGSNDVDWRGAALALLGLGFAARRRRRR